MRATTKLVVSSLTVAFSLATIVLDASPCSSSSTGLFGAPIIFSKGV